MGLNDIHNYFILQKKKEQVPKLPIFEKRYFCLANIKRIKETFFNILLIRFIVEQGGIRTPDSVVRSHML